MMDTIDHVRIIKKPKPDVSESVLRDSPSLKKFVSTSPIK